MSVCERLSDRMPEVALGRVGWSAEEARHLDGCADCRAEWDLIRLAGRVGTAAPGMAAHPALAAGVLQRLREAPVPSASRRPRRWAVGLAAAAGMALAVWTGVSREPAAPAGSTAVAQVSDTLEAAEVDSLLEGDAPIAGWSMLESPGLGDLDEGELERVLSTWEG
jgi:ferric-dicitrate binding protein FerR (iron transport regulator)